MTNISPAGSPPGSSSPIHSTEAAGSPPNPSTLSPTLESSAKRMRSSMPEGMPPRAEHSSQSSSPKRTQKTESAFAALPTSPQSPPRVRTAFPLQSFESPPSSSRRHISSFDSPPASAIMGAVPTQAKPAAADVNKSKAATFLIQNLKSTVLADLACDLDARFTNWAFTGSVALNVYHVVHDGEMKRPFHDADVVIENSGYLAFVAQQQNATGKSPFLNPGAESGDRTHYKYKDLLIDILPLRGVKPIPLEIVRIEGVPVVPLASLITFKERNLGDEELAKKAQQDLVTLRALQALGIGSSAPKTISNQPTPEAAEAGGSAAYMQDMLKGMLKGKTLFDTP